MTAILPNGSCRERAGPPQDTEARLRISNLILKLSRLLERGDRKKRFMTRLWQETGSLRVRREAPVASDRGKVLPLRVARRS